MFRSRGTERQNRFDWLPWGLSVFGAGCAAFVLVQGVLPERSANRQLVQKVARLETDLAQAAETANVSLQQVKSELAQQNLSTQAQVSLAREQESARAALEAARRDISQSLAPEIAGGSAALGERNGQLTISLSEQLLFYGDGAGLRPAGRTCLRELSKSMQRLPAEQVYQLSGGDERRHRSVARFLEQVGRVPRARLALNDGATKAADPTGKGTFGPDERTIQITLLQRKR